VEYLAEDWAVYFIDSYWIKGQGTALCESFCFFQMNLNSWLSIWSPVQINPFKNKCFNVYNDSVVNSKRSNQEGKVIDVRTAAEFAL
jgi:hypothetical protein